MNCQRSQQIDLLGFLENPRAAEFADFRDHYPRCADCSSEVRAWSELRSQLGAGAAEGQHLSPEVLLRLAADEALGDAQQAAEQHLAGCPACREELRTLQAFDPAALDAPSTVQTEARPRTDWLAALRSLLWSPAFAYLLVGLVMLPLLYDRFTSRSLPQSIQSLEPSPAALEEREQDVAFEDERSDMALAADPKDLDRAQEAYAPPQATAKPSAPRENVARSRRLRSEVVRTLDSEAPQIARSEASAARDAGSGDFLERRTLAKRKESLKQDRVTPIEWNQTASELEIEIPLPPGWESAAAVDVWIDAVQLKSQALGQSRLATRGDGATTMPSRNYQLQPQAGTLRLSLPPGSLAPGSYRLRVRREGSDESVEYRFEVLDPN